MPYGIGYGPGRSVGESAAYGLQSGMDMAMRQQQFENQKQQQQFENQRQTAADQRAQQEQGIRNTASSRQAWLDQGAGLQQEQQEHANLMQQTAQAAGGPDQVDPAVRAQHIAKAQDIANRTTAWRQAAFTNYVQPQQQQAQDVMSNLQAGNLDINKVAPADLAKTMNVATSGRTQDYMPGPNGEPSPIKQAYTDATTGLQTNNEGMMLRGVNKLFEHQINVGLGPQPDGSTILKKEIVKMVPDQNDPTSLHPVLGVTVKNPDGSTHQQIEPMTQNRSMDPNDPIKTIKVDDIMDQGHQQMALSSAFENPDFAKKVQQGQKDASGDIDSYNQAFAAVHGTPGALQPALTERKTDMKNGVLVEMMDPKGRVVSSKTIAYGVSPDEAAKAASAEKVAGIRAGALVQAAGVRGAAGQPNEVDPDTVDFYANQSLAGDNKWQVGLGRGKVGQALIAAVKDRIPQLAKEGGMTPQDVSATGAQSAALTKTLADRQKYVTSVEQLNGTLSKQLDLVQSLIDKGAAKSGTPLLNTPIQKLREVLGDADVSALNAAISGAAREHQRVLTSPMSNAQLHASAQNTADQLLNKNQSVGQMLSVMKVMRQEAQNGLDQGRATLDQTRNSLSGLGKARAGVGATQTPNADDDALINKYLKK